MGEFAKKPYLIAVEIGAKMLDVTLLLYLLMHDDLI